MVHIQCRAFEHLIASRYSADFDGERRRERGARVPVVVTGVTKIDTRGQGHIA